MYDQPVTARVKWCPDASCHAGGVVSQPVKPLPSIESSLPAGGTGRVATLRNWRPGDRAWPRHSSGPRKVKEVLERLRVTGTSRAMWPVLELEGQIVWMQGVELEPTPGIRVTVTGVKDNDGAESL